MPMASPAMAALMTVAMMLAMMVPVVAPTLWRHHRGLRAERMPRAGLRTTVVAVGYATVWTAIGAALFSISAEWSSMATTSSTAAPFGRWAGAVVLCAGALQCSQWKATRLLRCREACLPVGLVQRKVMTAWVDGCGFGVDCGLSCVAPMAVLVVAGRMDTHMMLAITAAVTVERVAPDGVRIARLTGALAVIAGLVMCAEAIAY